MNEPNPYRPPGDDPATVALREASDSDAFVRMLPTPQVRAAGVSAILTGVATIFVAVQFVLGARPGLIADVIIATFAGLGAAYFGVAWGLSAARAWPAIAGMALSLVTATGLVIVFFLSGAASCVTAGIASVVTLILLAVSAGDVHKMARARTVLTRDS